MGFNKYITITICAFCTKLLISMFAVEEVKIIGCFKS